MALYLYEKFVQPAAETPPFENLYYPGTISAWSGIYRCEVCGHEVVHTHDKPLPPEIHHVHAAELGPILWRLIVTPHVPK